MLKRDKQREVFMSLVNKQLEPHGVTYEDVKTNQDWYMQYQTTRDAELEFVNWGTSLIRKELRLSKSMAQNEMSWFILQWGLTTNLKVDLKSSKTSNSIKSIKKARK